MHANEEGQCPRVRVLRGQLRDAARAISEMRGVKVHRQEMVRNLITAMGEAVLRLECGEEGLDTLCSVLTKVGEGDLDEEDDGYYSSSDEEGVVTEEMAARGVGEAGCVTVSDKIWNSLLPRDSCCPWNSASVLIALSRGRGGAGRRSLARILRGVLPP